MINQSAYGKMDVDPEPRKGGSYSIPCAKCKCVFLLEKKYKQLYIQSMYYARTKEGALAPATPKDIELFNLCSNCYNLVKEFLNAK